jgi:ABC-type uncharacterized transport system involved in gliding motility auxiliary subunit
MYGFNQPVYIPLNTGLEKLLQHYGVGVSKSYVMDKSCYIDRGGMNREEMAVYFAPIIKDRQINHDLDFLDNIKELIMVKISPLEKREETLKKNGLEVSSLFNSSHESWEMKGRINLLPMFINPPSDEKEMKSHPLAYMITGEFPSYFTDKPIPEKPQKEEEDEAENNKELEKDEKEKPKPVLRDTQIKGTKEILLKGRPGKIFLIASTDILKDNILDEEGVSPNAMFLTNTIDYLNNREDIAILRSKIQRFNPIEEATPFMKAVIKIFNIGGIPVLFVIFGIFVWFRRKLRRKSIFMMFKR